MQNCVSPSDGSVNLDEIMLNKFFEDILNYICHVEVFVVVFCLRLLFLAGRSHHFSVLNKKNDLTAIQERLDVIMPNNHRTKSQSVLWYILIDEQMFEKVFCSKIAPFSCFVSHLFYKAEYKGRSCLNQVWAMTFDWSALATWNKHSGTSFVTWHREPATSTKPSKWGTPKKSSQNAVQKCLFQVASALQSKVMAQTWLGQLCPMYSAL